MASQSSAAAAWDAEYAAGRYSGEPPVAFTGDILAAAGQAGLTRGLYIGCGNGRNYLPLVAGGLDLTGVDISAAAIAQLAARAPDRADRLVYGDLGGIPSGPPGPVEGTAYDFRKTRTIGTTWLDHALTDLDRDGDGRAWVHLAASSGVEPGVRLWAGEGYRWLQVFTGDPLDPDLRRRALAVEPMTCPPNAFVTGDDLLILSPGEAITHTWGIDVL